jgi:multidrug efflux pump subunit AcrA (membrane-fusion protein)
MKAIADKFKGFFFGRDRRFYIILAVVVLIVGWMGMNWYNRDIVSIKAATVTRGEIQRVVIAPGTVKAPVFELGSKMGGKLAAVLANEGDLVYKGQLLATFDNYEQAKNDYDRTLKLFKDGFASAQSLDGAKMALDLARIISPSNGVVAKSDFRAGETVVPGNPAIIVVDEKSSWVEAQIDEIDLPQINAGQKAIITSDNYPDKQYLGTITWISPLGELRKVGGRVKMDEESYVFPIKLKFEGEHKELKTNMSVNVEIVTSSEANALVIPREALFAKNEKQIIYVIKNNRALETTIEIGLRSYVSVEAKTGLREGDKVAITNLDKLKNRGRVKIEK